MPTRSGLTSGTSIAPGTSVATASVSPTANRLVLVSVVSQGVNTTDRQAPTGISGAGLTFTKIGEVFVDSFATLSVWRALSASPSTGALTISWSLTQDTAAWAVEEWADASLSGTNGSGAVGTPSTNTATGTTTSVSPTFSSASSGTFAASGWSDTATGTNATATADANCTEGYEASAQDAGFGCVLQTQHKTSNEATVDVTWSISDSIALLAFEVLAAGPVITDQPDDANKLTGETATFTVAATGTGTLTYQWQRDTGSGYSDIGGATSSSYTTAALTVADDADLYRCNVTDDNGTTASNSALLTVDLAATIGWLRA